MITRGEAAGNPIATKFQGSSTWLQKRFTDEDTWKRIKRCLPKTRFCDTLGNKYSSSSSTTNGSTAGWVTMPPLESGCCRPPRDCNFSVINITFYDLSTTDDRVSLPSPASGVNLDCTLYRNNATERCYACSSCKAAFLDSARGRWRTAAVINICVIALALVSSAYFLRLFIKKSGVGLVTGASADASPTRSRRCDPQSSVPGQPSSASTSTGPATASAAAAAAVAEEVQEAERTARTTAAGSRSPERDSAQPPRDAAADCLQMENGQNQHWECSEIQPK
ncbi:hypothetical protein CBR_g32349 [Chara braunii]|uniref:Tetraspanin n=1 Tax=Chara braunii TaxID=69332 RepID=A0A388JNH4_CHABU|nr:hypothetical protein CBR_g32349 [Chara braunii]|eukprot:GBG59337.1 hypothetical protein CBR_g32349 [Chara braunii]